MAARWWSESAKSFRRSSVVAGWVWFTKLRTRLDRFVAVKFLPDDVAGNRQVLERFRREAKAATAIYHRNICVLHDVGEENVPPADAISGVRLLIERQGLAQRDLIPQFGSESAVSMFLEDNGNLRSSRSEN
jgi:serine/threonine protein kinase